MSRTDVDGLPALLARDLDGAFPDLVSALQDDVYSGALRLTRDPHAAEDVTQEAFVRAYRALGGYEPERIRSLRLRGWIWTIAANLCRNRARSRARRPEEPLDERDPADRTSGPEQLALDAAGRLELHHAGAEVGEQPASHFGLKMRTGAVESCIPQKNLRINKVVWY